MALAHSKRTFVSLDGEDLSAFTNTSNFEKNSDEHDVTCYGEDAHVVAGGLLGGTATMGGFYDTGVGGPRAIIEALVGQTVEFIRQPEGTGASKPQDKVNVLVKKYNESNPVADYVTWSCDMTFSGTIDSAAQPA
jgi:hypothetical protein